MGTRVWIPPDKARSSPWRMGSPISSSYSGQFLAIKKKTGQCLCSVTAGTCFRAQSKIWARPESLPLLFSSLPLLFAWWPWCPLGCQVLQELLAWSISWCLPPWSSTSRYQTLTPPFPTHPFGLKLFRGETSRKRSRERPKLLIPHLEHQTPVSSSIPNF